MKELQDLARSFLEEQAPVRAQLADDGGATWKRLSDELGLTALATEASFVEVAAVLEETGRTLLRAPLLPALVATSLLPDLDPSVPVALALSGLDQVEHAPGAARLLVADGPALRLHDAFEVKPLQALDATRPVGAVTLTGDGTEVAATADSARDLLWVALAAEAVGASRKVLEMTVEHLKVREQFGRPLGSFQALRHRVADLTVALEAATSTTWYAARAAAGRSDDLPVAAPLAHATASEAFVLIAGEAIQLHGGIGFTWEHDCHLYFKRAWSTALRHGRAAALRQLAFERSGS
jgi:hypothetical protein